MYPIPIYYSCRHHHQTVFCNKYYHLVITAYDHLYISCIINSVHGNPRSLINIGTYPWAITLRSWTEDQHVVILWTHKLSLRSCDNKLLVI